MNERPRKTPRFSAEARARLARTFASGAKIERRADRSSPWPLSSGQERLYVTEEVLGPSALYHVPLCAHLVGPLDVRALEQALLSLLQRHELLRGRFTRQGEELRQTITDGLGFRLARHSLQGLGSREGLTQALELARAEYRRPFELARELPLRATLWSVGPEEHLLLVTLHHLVCDGLTIRVLCDELREHYAAERSGRPLSLIELELQHGDYALWQREHGQSAEVRASVAALCTNLAELPAPLDLPADHPRPSRWSARGGWKTRRIPGPLGASLEELAHAHGATPFQLFLAAFHAALWRWTGREDQLIGVPATLRDQPELERLPGFLVNTLALRTRVEGTLAFPELLARVRDTALEAFGHKQAPFEDVLARLQPPRDPARTPVFQVMFDHRVGLARELALDGLASGRLLGEDELHSGTSKVDLALYTELAGGEFTLSIEYRADLFEERTIERVLERLEGLLRALAAHPQARLSELPWLGSEERTLVTETWARGARQRDCESTVAAAFAEVAARLPHKVALEHGDERLTYAELALRARRLATRLLELGVERGEPVALCLSRRSALVVAELAILEAGGAYLPLDPNYPAERLRFMLEDSGARVLVSERALLQALPHAGLAVLDLEAEPALRASGTPPAHQSRSGAGDPAYLIYTSGSTGVPKGVACPQRGVLRLFRAARWLEFDERVRMVHLAPESFDASVLDIWGPLLAGGTLVLHPEAKPTLAGLARVVEQHRIDTLFLTTALFHALVDEAPETLTRLRQIATGGEALSLAHVERARRHAPTLALANCYGPTEATVIATAWSVPLPLPGGLSVAPIGTPIANTDVLVLDPRGEPVATGVAGELHVGGNSLALGYWRRPELTAERFVTDPRGPGLLYRTGDLARWRHDGTLEFLGRADDQVKIRGHRIELSEIENRLAEHPGVRRALVIAAPGADGTQRLLAYAVPGEARPSPGELAAHLAARLPEYMRPSACVLLDELPVTPGGKVDRARLPLPHATPENGLRTPPLGRTEETLAELWRELLGVTDVAREDDFFALGGHSLTATVLFARLARRLEIELPLATLFEQRTLAALARALDAARTQAAPEPLPARTPGATHEPLSSNQRGLWFLQELAPGSAFYNVPFALPLEGPLDPAALKRALANLVRRHDALRTVFPVVEGEPVQRTSESVPELEVLDLTASPAASRAAAATAALDQIARRPFELARGPLMRALLVREDEQRATLGVCVHHIVFDGWSFDVFLAELAALYEAEVHGSSAHLPTPAPSYLEHAWRQRHALTPERRAEEGAFWQRELAGAPLVLELPLDHPRPATPSWRGAKVLRSLPAAKVARLVELARSEGATPYLAGLTLAEVLLARHAGVEDLVLGTPVAGRTRPECERAIGLYLNVVPIRAELGGAPSFRTLLARTRTRVLAAHAHQEFPFESLVEALAVERDPALTPVYQALFSLRRAARPLSAGGVRFAPAVELDTSCAKTDLALTLEEREGDWLLDLTYAADLFDAATMERLAERFEVLLDSALAAPERPVQELELATLAEREELARWRGRTPAYPRDEGLASLFERAAQAHPASVAVSLEGHTLTYAELDARANRLAHELIALGVARGSRVGLCVDRSLELPVALLAILKSGGAYVPLDPSYPKERLELMLSDAGIEVLLVDEALVSELPESGARRVVLESLGALEQRPATSPGLRSGGEDLAYVMYTSGSTGKPKGVEIPQRAISRLVFGATYATFDATRVWLQLAPISFDASTLEIWGALLHGARLALYPERVPTAEDLERVLRAEGVTSLWLTAALFNAIVDERPQALAGVRECLTGGEALSVAHIRRAHAVLPPGVQLVNGYGPTENTTFTCCYRIPRELPADVTSIPIGHPIENTSVHVVDRALRPVPIGVAGELVTGGDGLAHGYRARPELDAERFVTLPDGERVYRTGDRVRWLADGRIEFLGRSDDQVKIRGHRIEPGEIAVVLGTHPLVQKAFVTVHDVPASGKTLVAYFEARGGAPCSASELSSWLAERIPGYMIPSAFMCMEALPMNANGKVDRKRLPDPIFETRSTAGPRNDMEGLLATLWQQVLKVERVGPDDDFFELGGHSLLAVRLVQAIRDAFGQELELASLVSAPTLAEQALLLHAGIGTQRSSAVVKLQTKGDETPIFCVCSLGGTVLNQRPLAVRLADRPFYGLQAIELDSKLGRPATIEDYAAAYIEAMKKVQPRGPYVIGGHSFGGIVSYEIAQQLQKGGDEVEMLFILDSSLPNLDKGALDRMACIFAFLRGLPYLPAETLQQIKSDPEHLTRALKQKLRFVARKTGLAPKPAPGPRARPEAAPAPGNDPGSMRVADVVEMTNWPENNRKIAQRHWRAVQGYRPQRYPGRITLFRSRFQSPFLGLGSAMGWDRVAMGGVEIVRVPGGHLSVLQPPNVDVLARRFLERLERRRRAA